jgi:nucleoside-diphosphate-sugar epimerase
MHYGPPEPTNRAYGLAKLSALYGAQAFEKQYGLSVCNLIAVNMYGPYDNFSLYSSHVIPAMIRKICTAKDDGQDSVTLWGTGKPTREFLYVRDFSDAVWLAATAESMTSDAINIGSSAEISMSDLAIRISDIIGYGGYVFWDSGQPDGQMRRCLDTTKAKSRLGFNAKIDLDRGLRETIKWYLEKI